VGGTELHRALASFNFAVPLNVSSFLLDGSFGNSREPKSADDVWHKVIDFHKVDSLTLMLDKIDQMIQRSRQLCKVIVVD